MTGENNEELLRLLGRELEDINRNTARTAGTLAWLLLVTLANLVLVALWLVGVIEVTVSQAPFG